MFQEIQRPKWTDRLSFPDDVTRLNAANVSELLGKYSQLWAYTNQELCKINVAILRLQTAESRRRNEIFRRNPAVNSQDRWRRDAVLESDPLIEKFLHEIEVNKMRRTYTDTYLANFDRYINALSRELSRKMNEASPRH